MTPATDRPAITAIVVDDHPDHCLLAQRLFSQQAPQLRVQIAHDGLEGLQLLAPNGSAGSASGSPGAPRVFVLLDLEMPRLNGFEFLERMRQQLHGANVPVFVLSACADDESIRRAYQLGAHGFIPKPLSHPASLRTLQRYFDLLSIPISLRAGAHTGTGTNL